MPPRAQVEKAATLRELAGTEASLHEDLPDFWAALSVLEDATWYLREDNYEPALEHELESRFSVSNGSLGIRGSLDLPAGGSRPRTYVAGLFESRPGPPAVRSLVPAPQAFPLRLVVDGEWVDISQGQVKQHVRLLDYQSGCLRSFWRHELNSGLTVSLDSLRFVSKATPMLATQLIRLTFERRAMVAMQLKVDGDSALAATDKPFVWRTNDGLLSLARQQAYRIQVDDTAPSRWLTQTPADLQLNCEKSLSLLQVTAYGLDIHAATSRARARRVVEGVTRSGFRHVYDRHAEKWDARWRASDVKLEGDEEAQRALRFAVYHLNSAIEPSSSQTSIGARGLTGDAYMGHVFWDTDIFMLPFYVFTWPEAARSLLSYRHRTLDAARAKARRLGFRGALYSWESTDTGEEATPPYVVGPQGEVIAIRSGDLEHHVSAAVAYGVWQYWQATHDTTFLLSAGAEILLETARFWASRFQLGTDGANHLRNVIGPDEYHEGVDDNAYTNGMARWNIETGLKVATLIKRRWPDRWHRLAEALTLDEGDLAGWRSVAHSIFMPTNRALGVLEQFAGYADLDYVDLAEFAGRSAPMDVLLGAERTARSQVSKQADALMLIALLPEALPLQGQLENFRYYEPRCGHGSSLSPPVHSLVAARVGLADEAMSYFRKTAEIDLSNSMGNSAAGLHMAALGGLWQAAVFGFGGMSAKEDGLAFEPRLPHGWERLCFPIQWRGRRLTVDLSAASRCLTIELERGRPMPVHVNGDAFRLEASRPLRVGLPAHRNGGKA